MSSSDRITRRTFEAKQHPKGSEERARLNERAETSEYMTSYKFVYRDEHGATSFKTRTAAETHADWVNR